MPNTPQVFYNGNNITCYPSSNSTDNGKLNLEFNMARLVTRLSSKNFCILNPSFEITTYTDPLTGVKTLQVGPGQASINGMDLIMTDNIYIDPPLDTDTKYYLAFHLHRDPSDNVRGDLTVGVDVTFEGLSLSYYTDKGENDKDRLNLGTIIWDGTDFTITEDEDKYGRIWAEDILCKLLDSKHPDTTRILLQDWLYNVPDWYFSKEGDTIYNGLQLVDNRTSNNPGILMNVDSTSSNIVIKNPSEDNSLLQIYGDLDRDGSITQLDLDLVNDYIAGTGTLTPLQLILADVNGDGVVDEKDAKYIEDYINSTPDVSYGKTGQIYFIDSTTNGITYIVKSGETTLSLAKSQITSNSDNNWALEITSTENINQHSDKQIYIQGDQGVHIGSGGNGDQPELLLQDHKMSLSDSRGTTNNLTYEVSFPNTTTIQQKLGKAIWKYDNTTQYVSLLSTDVSRLSIIPVSELVGNVYARANIYVRAADIDTTYTTDINRDGIQIINGTNNSQITNNSIQISTDANTNGSILLKKSTNNSSAKLLDTGDIELRNTVTGTPGILFTQGVSANDVTLAKVSGQNKLNLLGGLTVSQIITASGEITGSGITTANGILTFKNGTNDATINKSNGSSLLYTSNGLNVGQSGNQPLKAGESTFSGNVVVGLNGVRITTNGNIDALGTITGSKVIGAVYQGFGELFRKVKNDNIEYGDIVCIRKDGLVHKVETLEDLKTIIGICSNTIGVQMGGLDIPEDERVEVEMLGQIWVKTNDTNIHPGSLVKALPDATVGVTYNVAEKFGIAETEIIDGKVKIVYGLH